MHCLQGDVYQANILQKSLIHMNCCMLQQGSEVPVTVYAGAKPLTLMLTLVLFQPATDGKCMYIYAHGHGHGHGKFIWMSEE